MNNLLKEEQREIFNNMSITELRTLGHSFNIKSPTSQSKNDLIEEILEFLYGDDEQFIISETRGRQVEPLIIKTNIQEERPNSLSTLIAATNVIEYKIVGETDKEKNQKEVAEKKELVDNILKSNLKEKDFMELENGYKIIK